MIAKRTLFPDLFITIPAMLLMCLGILVIFTSSVQLALQQGLVALVGLAVYWAISSVDCEVWEGYIWYLYIITILLLVLVFVLGEETRGSIRWIQLGMFNLQPSEFAKPVLILVLAKFWVGAQASWKNILKSLLVVFPILALVFKQPDLGSTIILAVIWLSTLVAANVSIFKLAALGFVSLVMAPVGWIFLKDYQKVRFISFLYPGKDPLGLGYNVIQSTIAVGSGQLTGRGLGRGTQSRLQFLPEFRTDFIFASIAEELGFVGSLIVLVLYSCLILKGLKVLGLAASRFGHLVATGVLGMLFFQVVINIGMNIGLMPVTGITLPLLSYGGSSLLVTLICLGLLASVGKFSKKVDTTAL